MSKIEELRAEVSGLHEKRTRLERERDAVERMRSARIAQLQELCPHDRVVELTGDVKHPGEKTIRMEMRACRDCNHVEHATGLYDKLARPTSLAYARYNERSAFEVLGCTL